MELGTLLNRMMDECDVDNYEEWVEKLDIRPELRQQLDHIVSEERQRIEHQRLRTVENQSDVGDIWATKTSPLTDEVIERLLASGEITQEQLDTAKEFIEDGEQLEWNPETKSIMTAPQLIENEDEKEKE